MIEFTEEQLIIRDSVARYLDENHAFDQRQKHLESEESIDRKQWREFAELGWLGLPLPETYGGYGGSLVEAAIIWEQLGRSLHRSPYLSNVIAAGMVLITAGNETQKSYFLSGIAEGELIVACAISEKSQQSRELAETTTAENKPDGYEINGHKALVPYASIADCFIVSALLDNQTRLFLVPADSPGVKITSFRMYDGSRTGEVTLSSVAVGEESLLVGDSATTVQWAIDCEVAMLCVEAAGIMSKVQEQTLEYLKIREQFGQKLAGFQALQHRAVDMYVYCQLAQSMAWDAVDALVNESDSRIRSKRVSAAKCYIGEKGRMVGKEGIQLHGGIAMTDDLPIGHYLKRLTAIDHLHGNSASHRERFISLGDFDSEG